MLLEWWCAEFSCIMAGEHPGRYELMDLFHRLVLVGLAHLFDLFFERKGECTFSHQST